MQISFFIFSIIFLGIYFLMNCYLYLRIVDGFDLTWKKRKHLRVLFVFLALPLILDRLLSGFFFVYPMSFLGMLWLGFLSLAICVFLVKDIIGLFFNKKKREMTWFALLATLILAIYSFMQVYFPIPIKEIKLKHDKIPAVLSGFTIVQLTDVHIDKLKSLEWTEELVSRVNYLKPDLIVLTGDLNDLRNLPALEKYVPVFRKLQAKYGIYAVAGNHEYYNNLYFFNEFCQLSNIKVLYNEKISLSQEIDLAGISDPVASDFGSPGPDLKKALGISDPGKLQILLSHRPQFFKEASEAGVFLQLSGHTHAGQIPPMAFLVYAAYRYPHGLYQKNGSILYVSPGTGYWGPPMRLFSKSEITRITFQ